LRKSPDKYQGFNNKVYFNFQAMMSDTSGFAGSVNNGACISAGICGFSGFGAGTLTAAFSTEFTLHIIVSPLRN
jgi:hypothetical protein